MQLIDLDFLRSLFSVTKNGSVAITRKITEAQKFDLGKSIGGSFLIDIENNPLLEKYVFLLEGGEYEDANQNKVTFGGLKTALAYFTYAALIDDPNNITYTEYGAVKKISNLSENIDTKAIARAVDKNRQIGVDYVNEVLEYVKFKKSDYPLYKDNCTTKIDALNTSFIGIRRNNNMFIKKY